MRALPAISAGAGVALAAFSVARPQAWGLGAILAAALIVYAVEGRKR